MEPGGRAEALGAAYERSLARARRKLGGVFYTPPGLARYVVAAALAGSTEAVRVVDPACGGGALLVAAYRWLLARATERGGALDAAARRRILELSIFGVDVDAEAVAVARAALAEVAGTAVDLTDNVRVGDAIRDEDRRTFEVVVANPPYLDAEAMTRHHAELRAFCQGRYRAARGNWDLYCVFIERCLQLCAAGGRVGLVVPNRLLSAGYAGVTRALIAEQAALREIRVVEGEDGFAAEVYPIAVVATRGAAQGEVVCERVIGERVVGRERVAAEVFAGDGPWALGSGAARALVAGLRARGRPLGELAEVRGAATVAEAYAIAGAIREGDEGLRVVNSGTIDAHTHLWGRKRLRYLGASYLRPVIAGAVPAKRLADARAPKVIVSGMTRALEAVLDREGGLFAAKSTTVITSGTLDLRYVVAWLNSEVVRGWYGQVFGGERLAGAYLRVGPPQLRQVPVVVPTEPQRARIAGLVDALGERPTAAQLRAIDVAVAEIAGVDVDDQGRVLP